MDVVIRVWEWFRRYGQNVGPYLMLEILMPGGTLLALLLFLYQRRQADIAGVVQRIVLAVTRTLANMIE